MSCNDFKKYEFTIKVKTNHDPRQAIFEIVDALKGMLPVLSIEHRLVEDRPTTDEHHGGVTNEDELTNYRVNADGTKTDLSRGFVP